MRAIRLHAFGAPDNLRYEELPDPEPGPRQVRIRVEASGVHFVDTAMRRGEAGPFPRPRLPAIPGREVAGVVEALGAQAPRAWLGRSVVVHLGAVGGGYAEQALAPVEALHEIPRHIEPHTAVAMIGTGRTALLIMDTAAVTADDVVLVTAAASGLGSLLAQAARNAGARVVGAAGGPEKTARTRDNGATVAVDYRRPDWTEQLRRTMGDTPLTVALDGVGGTAGRGALELLGPGGRLVAFGWASGTPTTLTVMDLAGRGLTVTAPRRPNSLRRLEARALAEAGAGRLVPLVGRFPLAQAAAAHAAVEARATVGKTVLIP
jgi:NADPH2:quinone reductase